MLELNVVYTVQNLVPKLRYRQEDLCFYPDYMRNEFKIILYCTIAAKLIQSQTYDQ